MCYSSSLYSYDDILARDSVTAHAVAEFPLTLFEPNLCQQLEVERVRVEEYWSVESVC